MIPRAISYLIFVCCLTMVTASGVPLSWAQEAFVPFVAESMGEGINVRAGQSENFERLCQLKKGEQVLVVDKDYSWYKIQLPPSAKCYVHKGYVQFLGKNAGGITADRVNVRAGAGTHHTILGQLTKGEQIYIQEEFDDWYRIEPAIGFYGWVTDEFLVLKSKDISGYALERPSKLQAIDDSGFVPVINEQSALPPKLEPVVPHEPLQTTPENKKRPEPTQESLIAVKEDEIVVSKGIPQKVQEEKPARVSRKKERVTMQVPPQRKEAKLVQQSKPAEAEKPLPPPKAAPAEPPVAMPTTPSEEEVSLPGDGVFSALGYVELYEKNKEDGIHYQIIRNGETVCYVEGVNHMLGRFVHHQVTVEGTVNPKLSARYKLPVISVFKVRLML